MKNTFEFWTEYNDFKYAKSHMNDDVWLCYINNYKRCGTDRDKIVQIIATEEEDAERQIKQEIDKWKETIDANSARRMDMRKLKRLLYTLVERLNADTQRYGEEQLRMQKIVDDLRTAEKYAKDSRYGSW